MTTFAPAPRHPGLADALGELPAEPFTEPFHRSVELVERYGGDWALELATRLGLADGLAEPADAAALAARRGFAPSFVPALDWILRRLAADRALAVTADGHYRVAGALPAPSLAELRSIGLAEDPAIRPTLDLLDLAAGLYPALALGEAHGERALFGTGNIALWCDYFDNRNPVYAINNLVTAVAVAHRLPVEGRCSLLEVGAGAGSATAALLEELERTERLGAIARYEVTEPSAFFRRRGERNSRHRFPGVPLRYDALDINPPLVGEALAGDGFDMIFGVNVLHVARDLPATLAALADRLKPGGWLVAGECIRLFPGQPVAAELVFLALEGFVNVELDGERRPNPGFLTPEQWLRLFAEAGLTPVEIVPDLTRVRDLYPRFHTGAICGRRAR